MKTSMIKALIRKDWLLHRKTFVLFAVMALLSVAIFAVESTKAFYLAMSLLLTMVILIGALLVFSSVVNERKEHTLPFVMSLPITIYDYTLSKMLFNLGAYLAAWLLLLGCTVVLFMTQAHLPNGLIPMAVIVLLQLLLSFFLVLGAALVSGSEKVTIVVTTLTNVSVSLFMFWAGSFDGIYEHLSGDVAVWNHSSLGFVVSEVVLAVMIVAGTFYLQSRKKDYI